MERGVMGSIRFDDRVAIVTGAGRGLGKAYALELGRRGAKVVVNDVGASTEGSGVDNGPADLVAREIISQGGSAIAHYGDITDIDQAKDMVNVAIAHFGGVHILINNAGITRDRMFVKKDLADFRKVIDVHLFGTVNVTHAVWPHFLAQNYGRILVTTSISGTLGSFGQADYSLAKAGMLGFMKTLALEGGRKDVHTNAISPAAATRMTENLLSEQDLLSLNPERVVPTAIFLVSDEAPNGCALQAGGNRVSHLVMAQNPETVFPDTATAEDVAASFHKIIDNGPLYQVRSPTSG
jgi:NAD(P)-dependent dehydrogenase (short-subunit alcohol dehydrogenase family)